MSSLYVRQTVEAWMKDPAMTVPFYSTVNEEQNPVDPIWVTVDYNPYSRDVVTLCRGDIVEEGDVELVYQGPPGTGYTALLTAAEADVAVLMNQVDASGKLTLTQRSAPFEYSNGDADLNYEIAINVEYHYSE